jgi:MFS family permease
LARLLSRPDFKRLLVGQTASGFGDWMATVGLLALVHERTGSSTAVGGVLVLRLAPAAFAGPLAAKLVGRFDNRQTMLVADAFRAVIVALLPLWDVIAWIYAAAFLLELGGLVFLPARDAAVPRLTEGRDLELANGLILGTSYGTIPLGAAGFAAVAAFTGNLAIVFWIDAVTFGVSFAAIARIAVLKRRPRQLDEGEVDADAEAATSFRAAWRVPLVRAIVPVAVGVALGLGALFSVGVVYVREVLDASNATFAGLVALFGVGAAAGLGLLHTTGGASVGRVRWLVASQGLVIAAMSQAPGVAPTLVGALLFGGTAAAGLAAAMSVLQERLVDRELFLAFTAFHVVIRAGLAVAALAAGVAADLLDAVEWPLVGRLEGARVVLLGAGLMVAATSLGSRSLAGLATGDPPADPGFGPLG